MPGACDCVGMPYFFSTADTVPSQQQGIYQLKIQKHLNFNIGVIVDDSEEMTCVKRTNGKTKTGHSTNHVPTSNRQSIGK